jgi:hypothetical protein
MMSASQRAATEDNGSELQANLWQQQGKSLCFRRSEDNRSSAHPRAIELAGTPTLTLNRIGRFRGFEVGSDEQQEPGQIA